MARDHMRDAEFLAVQPELEGIAEKGLDQIHGSLPLSEPAAAGVRDNG